ncbi:hypothetical protein KM043_016229 [Ampulex compressa]|nr:hypothetical protein KM043_016229 [Ampulex compressa]
MAAKTAKAPAQKPVAATNSEVASLEVSLPQMLDLALGTPETMVTSLKAGPTLHLHEYSITDASGNVKQRLRDTDAVNVDVLTDAPDTDKEPVSKVEKTTPSPPTNDETHMEKDSPEATTRPDTITTKGIKQQIGPGLEGEFQTVIFVEPVVDGTTPTALSFKQLENSVRELQQRFQALEELSTTSELIERLKGKITDPVTDVWQIINITKRLDASEQGIDKLTTIVQDVMKGETNFGATGDTSQFEEKLANMENDISDMERTIINLQTVVSMLSEEKVRDSSVPTETEPTVDKDSPDTDQKENDKETVDESSKAEKETVDEPPKPTKLASRRATMGGIDIFEMQNNVSALKTEVALMRKDLHDLNQKMIIESEKVSTTADVVIKPAHDEISSDEPLKTEEKPKQQTGLKSTEPIEGQLTECIEEVRRLEAIYGDTLQQLASRIETLEKEVSSLSERIQSVPTKASDDSELNEVVKKIQDIRGDMERLNETADRLMDDKENREIHLNALLEQIELLKTIKADKEDLEDALADKADAHMINRKVSHDQFDAACDDLARGLEDAIGKLGKQETIWQQALDEVQREIESKVDKIEISPLRDFVNNRLKSLQEKLKSMAEMSRENEAAGTKKMLRDVQCISCDKNVVMRMEDTAKIRLEPLPATMSMKPYLTYELDQVRKQQRKLPHSRNMIQFEAALQEETRKQKSAREELLAKTPRDHLCNRYCGGSHTVTTPQQRVMRLGHFLSQWGPETVQLTDGVVKGTDGKMYRGRPMPGKIDVCGPCCENEAGEETRTTSRPAPNAATPRKSISSRRGSVTSRRRSSKKSSQEPAVKEPIAEQLKEIDPMMGTEEAVEGSVPIDPTAHEDEIVRYDEAEHETHHDDEKGQ